MTEIFAIIGVLAMAVVLVVALCVSGVLFLRELDRLERKRAVRRRLKNMEKTVKDTKGNCGPVTVTLKSKCK